MQVLADCNRLSNGKTEKLIIVDDRWGKRASTDYGLR